MIHIAICDDDALHLTQTEKLLNNYLKFKTETPVKVKLFSSGKELINDILEHHPYDLYILDIVMPEMSGIELALKLREMKDDGQIIYLTTEESYAVESYNTHAFHYLLKPIVKEKFNEVMNAVFALLKKQISNFITVKTQEGITKIHFDNLNYAELNHRRIHYYLTNGQFIESVTLRNTFADTISPLLTDDRFVLCGASFAINLHQVESIKNDSIFFNNKAVISPPKKAIPTLRSQWLNYWLEETN